MNRPYGITCDDLVETPTTVAISGGSGTTSGPGIDSAHTRWDVSIEQVTQGDLPSVGNVTAVLFRCSPQPSDYSLQELRVYRSSDGAEIARIPHLDGTGSGPAGDLPPVFTAGSVTISNGAISADVKYYGPDDTHASGPSQTRRLSWQWSGGQFTPAAG